MALSVLLAALLAAAPGVPAGDRDPDTRRAWDGRVRAVPVERCEVWTNSKGELVGRSIGPEEQPPSIPTDSVASLCTSALPPGVPVRLLASGPRAPRCRPRTGATLDIETEGTPFGSYGTVLEGTEGCDRTAKVGVAGVEDEPVPIELQPVRDRTQVRGLASRVPESLLREVVNREKHLQYALPGPEPIAAFTLTGVRDAPVFLRFRTLGRDGPLVSVERGFARARFSFCTEDPKAWRLGPMIIVQVETGTCERNPVAFDVPSWWNGRGPAVFELRGGELVKMGRSDLDSP